MLIFNLNGYSKLRIWFNHSANLYLDQRSQNKLYEFDSHGSKVLEDKNVILELYIPAGGRIYYGLLGFSYKYDPNNKLIVKTHSIKKINNFNDSLIVGAEPVYVGLPTEYEEFVYRGLSQAYKKNELALTGNLDFCYAAHGMISSCGWIYHVLSYCLVNMIFISEESLNKETLMKLLKEAKASL